MDSNEKDFVEAGGEVVEKKESRKLIDKFKNLSKKKKVILVVFLIAFILVIVASIYCYILFNNNDSEEDKNDVATSYKYEKLSPVEQGEYYAKYEVNVEKTKAFSLENGKKVVLSYNSFQNEAFLEYGDNLKIKFFYYNEKPIIFYTIGGYLVADDGFKGSPSIYIDDYNQRYLNYSDEELTEKGLYYSSYSVNDEGVSITYSRINSNSGSYKNHLITDKGDIINVCYDSEKFKNLDGNLIFSYDYVLSYDHERDLLLTPNERKNVVTVSEYRNNFDPRTCDEKKTFYLYKYEGYEGDASYNLTDDKPTRYEIIDSYTCKGYDCTYVENYEYTNNKLKKNRFYIYDEDKMFKYDVANSDGFKEISLPLDKTIDIVNFNVKINIYNDDGVKVYLGYSERYKEHTMSTNSEDSIELMFSLLNINVSLSEDTLKNNIVGITDNNNEKFHIYNFRDKKIIETIDEIMYGRISYNDKYIIVSSFSPGETSDYVYSKNYDMLVENKSQKYYTISDGKIIEALKEGNNDYYSYYKIFDEDEVTYSSKFSKLLMIEKDYAVIINKNNMLQVINILTEEVLADFGEYKENNYFHYMLSGTWFKDNKEGLYLIFSDPNAKCEDIDEKDLKDFFGDESYDSILASCRVNYEGSSSGESLGVEFYYIYDTGESGKFYTVIGGYAKPVLYLYPEEDKTKVTVKFKNQDVLTTTYPKYKSSWNVIADKDGTLIDQNGRSYYGLYWEESGSSKVDFSEGFYVTKDNAIDFLEEKLDILGFTEREANEFIMYWLPILEKNGKSLVYFELTESRENYNGLDISPKPDSMLRVAIHIKKVDKKTSIKEENLPTFKRNGFTVVEWGGVIHE